MAKKGYNGVLMCVVDVDSNYVLAQANDRYTLHTKEEYFSGIESLLENADELDVYSLWWDQPLRLE